MEHIVYYYQITNVTPYLPLYIVHANVNTLYCVKLYTSKSDKPSIIIIIIIKLYE